MDKEGRVDHHYTEGDPSIVLDEDKSQTATLVKSYDAVPLLDQVKLPRGGVSVETKAVGRVQVRRMFVVRRSSDD
jgi:hypothetical protein